MKLFEINRRHFVYLFLLAITTVLQLSMAETLQAQTGTTFWLAPPQVTSGHSTGGNPTYIRLASGNEPATVTISQPANPGFNGGNPIVVALAANSSHTQNVTTLLPSLVTSPANTVLQTGLKIEATASITAVYEISSSQNPDIWALKGENGLGTEFYIPMQNIYPNGNYSPAPYTSFDIVATEDNTTVLVYPTKDLDGGQQAYQTFTISLDEGETYSASVTSTNASDKPSGSVVLSDKPIAISIKDDSVYPPGAGCRDLLGDQIVPVEIVGEEYIVNKGNLNAGVTEYAYAVATENNTQLFVNGSLVTTMFNSQTYPIAITANLTSITANKPFYLIHVTGFGCETGMAILPPLNCAGSEQISFVRSTNEGFFLNLLVPAGAEDAFVLNGNTTMINAGMFDPVPGTDGEWMGARIEFSTSAVPAGAPNLLVNTEEVFSMGLINGGSGSGCRYGYFSEFAAEIIVDAGANQTVCANRVTQLEGDVSGGATQGVWSTNGTGAFIPDEFALDAIYEPSLADLSAGGVTLTLTSISNCFPVEDQVVITYTPAPIVDAGDDIEACENNTIVTLNGYVDVATGGIWSGGAGTYSPSAGNLGATYTPTAAEVASGSLTLTLTSTGNGNCYSEFDEVVITFGPAPTANAGADQSVCENNAQVQLFGAVTGADGGVWSGGTGTFFPSPASLGATYTPSNLELITGTVTLTLTTTGNGGCNAVSDQMVITITDAPEVEAGNDREVCKNNSDIQLNGSVIGADGGVWSGGNGTFSPNATTLNAIYTPTLAETLAGGMTLTLSSTGNGDCIAVTDNINITFTNPPVVDAGDDEEICTNNPSISLDGSLVGANFGIWTGGAGTFSPNNTTLNATYNPTAAEVASGSVSLILSSLDNGNCNIVTDEVTFTFTPSPTANAGADMDVCENNASFNLNGSVTVAGGGQWSGGSGSFSPSSSVLATTYTPTSAEIASGSVTLTLTTTDNGNCNAVSDQITINFTDAPVANAGLDFAVCSNNADAELNGSVIGASGGVWSGGLGTFTPSANALNAVYSPTNSEINSGNITLTLTTTGNGNCNAVTDQVIISFTEAPTADAGSNVSVCANNASVELDGSVTIASGGTWSGGLGSFSPNANTLDATYTPTSAEITAGSVNLTLTTTGNGDCTPESDQMTISFTPAPTANAGSDRVVCANDPSVNLSGSISLASGAVWSGGSGTFSPNNTSLAPNYTPSAGEIENGSVTLTLTTTGNANCNAVSDQMVISITPAPVVDAGSDEEFCSNNATIELNGSVENASGGSWSGGNGTFTPNSLDLNATYVPSQTEINNGFVTLTLTSTGNGNCIAVTDEVTYSFSPAPTADAGDDQVLCANNAQVSLDGAVTVATGGVWSGGAGSFTPSNTALTAVYTPTAAEISSGEVTLTLTTTGNDDCNAVSDNVTVNFTPAPVVSAGPNLTSCANDPDVQLNGNVTIASGGIWSGGNGTFTPNNTDIDALYTPSAGEIAAGTVTLTLTSTGNGNCVAVSDQMTITINEAPVVDAGSDEEVCSNNSTIQLEGSVENATGGSWSGGSGTFTPNSLDLEATYAPSQTEINNGFVTLTLTSTGNGNCIAETDAVTFTFSPAPTADAGDDQVLCANNADVTLDGAVTIATGGIWSGGAGTYAPANTALNAVYTPSAAEITAGSVTLTLTTTGNDNCNAVSDNVVIQFTPAPTVNAGSDDEVCANNPDAQLNGSVSIATGGSWSGGNGVYSPNNSTLNAIYTPSAEEIEAGSVTLTLTSFGNGNCLHVTDQKVITINPAPEVDAGADQEYCANNATIELDGSVENAAGGSWSGGSGTFTPNSLDVNATYVPSQTEINNGFVTLTLTSTGNGDCFSESDDVTFTFSPAPTANAGADQELCANNSDVSLNGVVTVATGGVWSGGAGSYSPSNTDLNAVYTPTTEELLEGEVTLTLTTTGNENCTAVSDNLTIEFTPAPVVNAGTDLESCENDPEVQLNGSVTVADGGIWSGGTGTYNPANTALNAVYTPSAAEIANGGVTLTLTSTGNEDCNAVSDQVVITIDPAPVVEAGPAQSICSNNTDVQLSGSVLNAGGGIWSGGLGTFNPSSSDLNAVYTPTLAEVVSGSLTLTLTSTGNGNCTAESDQTIITFTPAPTVTAGTDVEVCATSPAVTLEGEITIASGGEWTGGNGTFSPNPFVLGATYTPTAAELADGSVTLTLTTTGNGNCLAVADDVTITYTPQPTVNAGANLISCENEPNVELDGSFSNAEGIVWSGGTGFFNPSNTDPTATYIPSNTEIDNGFVNLTITTTGNGSCDAVTDNLSITINPSPIVSAGENQEVCENNPEVTLAGSVQFANGGQWTGGAGVFSPSANNLTATYTPTAAEIANGQLNLTLTSTGNGTCNPVTDHVIITFTDSPVADAGADLEACENNAEVQLNGSFTVAEGAIWSGGVGTFNPGNTAMNATYIPTQNEINSGSVTLTLTTFGNGDCLPSSDQVEITFSEGPQVEAGEDYYACVDDLLVPLNGQVSGSTTTGQWSTGGTGVFVPNQSALDATYIASAQDSLMGEVTLTLTSTNNGGCSEEQDQLTIYISPAGQAHAGADQMVCANNALVSLEGSISGAATTGSWATSGTGTFFPNANALNADYTPSEADKNAGSVTLTLLANSCNQGTDQMVVTITPAPEVEAGEDITTCATELEIDLDGFVTGASSTGTWTTTGSGMFSPSANAINATYIASEEDVEEQVITLILSATGIGDCLPVSDSLQVSIFPAGVANAGADQMICENNPEIQLNGSLEVADEGIWTSSGSGSFSEATDLNAVYTPSQGDLNNGFVTLTLTATNSCNNAADQMTVDFTPAPVVDAGDDLEACGLITPFQISGSVQNANGGHWSSSGNGFFQNGNSLNTYYVASEDDAAEGGVYLYLTSTGNGNCLAVTDSLFISISSGIVVNAGPDRVACIDAGDIQLYGDVSNGTTTGTWTTTGNGMFLPNANALNAVYEFTQDDIDAGNIEFTLTSTNNGICQETEDSFVLTFGDEVFTYAGPDAAVCETTTEYPLSALVSGGSSTGVWSTSGTGTFNPSNEDLNATYLPSEEDVQNGSVELTITSTNSEVCEESSSSLTLSFDPEPVISAGDDVIVCSGMNSIQLLGTVSNADGGIWSTSGTGVFQPNDSALTAVYIPSSADSLSGNITLTLSSYGSGSCSGTSDDLEVSFADPIEVNAGTDSEICNSESSVSLSGTVVNATGGNWSTSGTGSFEPDNSDLNPTYNFSAEDLEFNSISFYLSSTGNGDCPTVIDTVVVTINQLAEIAIEDVAAVCTTDPVTELSATVENALSFQWTSAGTGNFTPNTSSLEVSYTPSAAELEAGVANITLTAVGEGSCADVSSQVNINYQSPAVVNAGADMEVCVAEGSVELNGIVSGGSSSGSWDSEGFGSFSPDNNQLTAEYVFGANDVFFEEGFELILTSTNNGPCEAVSDTLLLMLNPEPTVNAGNNIFVCENEGQVSLNGQVTNTSSVEWFTTGDGVFLAGENELTPDYIIGNQDANNESVELILQVEGLAGCGLYSDTLTLSIGNPLEASFTHSVACIGDEVQFIDATEVFTGEIDDWSWDFGNGSVSNQQHPQAIFTQAGSYNVQLVVESSIGCSDTIVQLVNVLEKPTAAFESLVSTALVEEEIQFQNQSSGATAYQWYFGDDMGQSTEADPSYAWAVEGEYTVSLIAINSGGCTDSTSQNVVIEGFTVLPPRLPNSFSPNNDGMNDIFYVRGGPFQEIDFRVYDGWGREIFNTTDQQFGWDGTDNGKQLPIGVYVYTIDATTIEGDSYNYNGKITLLR